MYFYLPRGRIPVYAGLILLCLVAAFFLGRGTNLVESQEIHALPSQDRLLEKLDAVRELHTCIGTIQTVVAVEEANALLGVEYGSKRMLYVAVGHVRAGVDLRRVDMGKIQAGRIAEALPPAEILDIKLDLERSYVYDVQKWMFAPEAKGLQGEAERKALREVRQAALDAGVLEVAEDQARRVLAAVLE